MKDVMHMTELADKLETTVDAIRGHIRRRTDAIPPWFYRGKRIVWRIATVEKWMNEKEDDAMRDRASRPARRRLGGNKSSAC